MSTHKNDLKEALKKLGYNTRMVSVREDFGGYSSTIVATIRDEKVNHAAVKKALSDITQIDRDEATGEILLGGNTYTDLRITDEVKAMWSEPRREEVARILADLQAQEGSGGVATADEKYCLFLNHYSIRIYKLKERSSFQQMYNINDIGGICLVLFLDNQPAPEAAKVAALPVTELPAKQLEAIAEPAPVVAADTKSTIRLIHTPTENDPNNYLINGYDIDELLTYCIDQIRPQSKEFYKTELRNNLTQKRESIIDRHAGMGSFYNVILGPYVTLTTETIQKALNSSPWHCDGGNYFHLDPELLTLIEAATQHGYVLRLSHSQAQWSDVGLQKLKNRGRHFVPIRKPEPVEPETALNLSAPTTQTDVKPAICEGEVERDTKGTPFAHLYRLAYDAYSNTSHYPERRGKDTLLGYGQELTEDLAKFDLWAKHDGAKPLIQSEAERYKNNYEQHLRAWLSASARCASSFITGPSNFPVRQQEKRHASERKRYDEFREWREKALKAIQKKLSSVGVVVLTELQQAERNLSQRTMLQEQMKAANVIIRKGKDVESKLLEAGLSQKMVTEVVNRPEWQGVGFQHYELTNNGAEIRRLTARVEQLKTKEFRAETKQTQEVEFDGGVIALNYEIDRLQILYPGKPDAATITKLKQHGFRWSPSNTAWQRQLTNTARTDAQRITGCPSLY